MIDDRRLPSNYTSCEVHQGYIIAVSGGRYAFFDTQGTGVYTYVKGGFADRAACHRAIELELVA